MEPLITYRLTGTQVWSYHFFAGRQMIGKASYVLSLSPVVRIESPVVSWYSMFQMNTDSDILSGVSRKVMDDRAGKEAFRIVYCEPGFYRILGGNVNLLVECRDEAHLFGNPGQPVMALTERIREWSWVPVGEPFFMTTVYERNVPMKLLSAILAFPVLKFF